MFKGATCFDCSEASWNAACAGDKGEPGTDCAPPLTPITNANIKEAVALWKSDQSNCTATFGHISFWDTGSVTNMDNLFTDYNGKFKDYNYFDEDLSKWDVSNVKSMKYVSMRARLSSAHRST